MSMHTPTCMCTHMSVRTPGHWPYTCLCTCLQTCLDIGRVLDQHEEREENFIGHAYTGHDYIGHNYIGYNYTGYNCIRGS